MAIVRERTKQSKVLDDSAPAGADLSALQFRLVDSTSLNNIESIVAVAGQGANFVGVLQNAPTLGVQAAFRVLGTTEIECASAITAGDEVTAAGAAGTIETAGAGDYVCGTAREDGVTGQCISVRLRKYQKN